MRAVERSPQRGRGLHAGRAPAFEVVARVADEHGAGGTRTEALERPQDGFGVGLGVRHFVGPDDHVERALERRGLEPTHRAAAHFARYEAEGAARPLPSPDGFDYPAGVSDP